MIQVSRPSTSKKEVLYLNEALSKNEIGVGDFIPRFENAWASFNGMKYGVTVNSGTSALMLALKMVGVGPGDEVIVPDFTMAACAFAVSYLGATPVFVDCRDDLNINPELIPEKITSKTKAILIAHIYGRKVDIKRIRELSKLSIIEDSAEGHGIKPEGDIVCYSFYGNKIISTGEGGMCLTNSKGIRDDMLYYKSMCFDKERTFFHRDIGFNLRLTNLQAAIGLAQVERVEEILEKRKQIEAKYNLLLDSRFLRPNREVLWMYDIETRHPVQLHDFLKKRGVDSRYFFKPISSYPMYNRDVGLKARWWSNNGLQLPTFTEMSEDEVSFVCQQVNKFGGVR